jgi:hypothetical protein
MQHKQQEKRIQEISDQLKMNKATAQLAKTR